MSDKLWQLTVITFVAIGYYNASTEISSYGTIDYYQPLLSIG